MGSEVSCRIPPATSTVAMKFICVAVVLLTFVAINAEGGDVLADRNFKDLGMPKIDTILEDIDDMAAGADDFNEMEGRLQFLEEKNDAIRKAADTLTTNLDKSELGKHSKD